ncbi:MAG: hypothetical protein ACHQE5_13645 [Actinomycetes bacterium]
MTSGPDSGDAPESQPASRRDNYAWPLVAIIVVVVPQVLVPARLRVGPPPIVPLIELAVFLVLLVIAAKPGPVPRGARPLVLVLFGLMAVANAGAATRLVVVVLSEGKVDGVTPTATRLLVAGTLVLSTGIVTFGLLYWQIDDGGPVPRQEAYPRYPDFLFPQTDAPELARPGWRPLFADYLYLSFTTVVAFSPTDTLPLTRRVKGLMAVQSVIALSVIVVVLARVINVLPAG